MGKFIIFLEFWGDFSQWTRNLLCSSGWPHTPASACWVVDLWCIPPRLALGICKARASTVSYFSAATNCRYVWMSSGKTEYPSMRDWTPVLLTPSYTQLVSSFSGGPVVGLKTDRVATTIWGLRCCHFRASTEQGELWVRTAESEGWKYWARIWTVCPQRKIKHSKVTGTPGNQQGACTFIYLF